MITRHEYVLGDRCKTIHESCYNCQDRESCSQYFTKELPDEIEFNDYVLEK